MLLQWGRVRLNAETQADPLFWDRENMASMGPRSVERGNGCHGGVPFEIGVASMGPRSVERGNAPVRDRGNQPDTASMGPRSVERGNTTVTVTGDSACWPGFNGAAFG